MRKVWLVGLAAAAAAMAVALMSPGYVLPLVYGCGFVCVAVLVKAGLRTGRWRQLLNFSPPPFTQTEWAVSFAAALSMFVAILAGWYRWT